MDSRTDVPAGAGSDLSKLLLLAVSRPKTPQASSGRTVVAAFFVTALLPRATWPLIDPDVWWHIRAGESILDIGAVPRTDTWSLTAAGHPWTSQDWLANVLMAIGDRIGSWGETLLTLGFAALAVAAFAILWRAMTVRQPAIGWLSRVIWLSAGLVLAGPTLGVRVQVFDLLMTALVVSAIWAYTVRSRTRYLVGLPLIAIVWVNLHAGWPLLFLLGGATLVGELVDGRLRPGLTPAPASPRALGALAVALLASAAVLVVNPNGIDIYGYPFATLELGTLKAAVGEWRPASLDNLFGWLLLGFVLTGVVPTFLFGWRRLRLADALILAGLTAMSVLAIRFLLVLGPVGGSIVALNLGPVISESQLGRPFGSTLRRMSQPRSSPILAVLVGLLVVAGVGLALLRAVPPSQAAEIAAVQPVDAVAWLQTHDVGSRVFNEYEWGGYIGLEMPEEPVFIDGRADVYGDAIIAEYVRTIGLDIDPQTTFDRYGIDHVLFAPDSALGRWLDASEGWQRAYTDHVAAIWVRTG